VSTTVEEEMLERALQEQHFHQDWTINLNLDLPTTLLLVAHVQLALRHPANQQESIKSAMRTLIDSIVEKLRCDGLVACAEMAQAGNHRPRAVAVAAGGTFH
jgi:hypothetical protein